MIKIHIMVWKIAEIIPELPYQNILDKLKEKKDGNDGWFVKELVGFGVTIAWLRINLKRLKL